MASSPGVWQSTESRVSFRAQLNPVQMVANLWRRRDLIRQLAARDILGRYRAARLGLLWAVMTPLVLLAVYTFVLSGVLGARFGSDPNEGRGRFALYLFCGMIVFNLFAEVVNRAPSMVLANPSYVTKVVFPLEVLVVSGLLTALFNALVAYGVWLIFWVAVQRAIPPVTWLYLPLVLVPVCLTTLGTGWVCAALGVFVRDVGHAVALVVTVLFFATPVFYRIEQVQAKQPAFAKLLQLNPLAHGLEDVRRVMVEGRPPDWLWWGITFAGSAAFALIGYAFFMKSKRAFADVL